MRRLWDGATALLTLTALGLSDRLIRGLSSQGWVEPTPVQVATIPAILRGRDVCVSAKTGSGKTAAFLLPMLETLGASTALSRRPCVVARLVLVPTRELAAQIAGAVRAMSTHMPLPVTCCVAVGGLSINPQMLALRKGVDLVIATPGRLLDLVDRHALRLSSVQMVVLDEADQLLSLGFSGELGRIRDLLPVQCQRMLFSATFPPGVRSLVSGFLSDPESIDIDHGSTPDASAIVQRVIEVDPGRRTALLEHLLTTHAWARVLVFVATRQASEEVAAKLQRDQFAAAALHGELGPSARHRALADFKSGGLRILVATDLAARGLDIAGLPAVVNYDLPRSAVDYLHRIGRTGRAGASGVAVSFVTADDLDHFALIERRHRLSLERESVVGFARTELARTTSHAHGGVKGKRRSKKDKLRELARSGRTQR